MRGEDCWFALCRAVFVEERKDLRDTRGRGIVRDVFLGMHWIEDGRPALVGERVVGGRQRFLLRLRCR